VFRNLLVAAAGRSPIVEWLGVSASGTFFTLTLLHQIHVKVLPTFYQSREKTQTGLMSCSLISLPSCILLRYFHSLLSINVPLRFLHDYARVLFELPRTNNSFEDLIQLFQRTRFRLRDEEVKPDDAYKVRSRPDIRVLRALHEY
jgi:hypothetical protein